jgi:hypothetical protein
MHNTLALHTLPDEILIEIAKHLDIKSLLKCASTAKRLAEFSPYVSPSILRTRSIDDLLAAAPYSPRLRETLQVYPQAVLYSDMGIGTPDLPCAMVAGGRRYALSDIQKPPRTHDRDIRALALCAYKEVDFEQLVSGYPHVTHMDLSHYNRVDAHKIAILAKRCKSLESISICGVSLTEKGLYDLAFAFPNLREIALSQCNAITDNGIKTLAEKCSNLTRVAIRHSHSITINSLKALAMRCQHLTHITLRDVASMNQEFIQVMASFQNLKCIDLYAYWITGKELRTLQKNCKNLKKINLYECTGITSKDLSTKVPCKRVTGVDLGVVLWMADTHLKALAYKANNLESINVGLGTKITDEGVTALVKNRKNLKHITLRQSNITDKSLHALANHCANLQYISLAFCSKITDSGVQLLLRQCKNLRHIALDGHGTSRERLVMVYKERPDITVLGMDDTRIAQAREAARESLASAQAQHAPSPSPTTTPLPTPRRATTTMAPQPGTKAYYSDTIAAEYRRQEKPERLSLTLDFSGTGQTAQEAIQQGKTFGKAIGQFRTENPAVAVHVSVQHDDAQVGASVQAALRDAAARARGK